MRLPSQHKQRRPNAVWLALHVDGQLGMSWGRNRGFGRVGSCRWRRDAEEQDSAHVASASRCHRRQMVPWHWRGTYARECVAERLGRKRAVTGAVAVGRRDAAQQLELQRSGERLGWCGISIPACGRDGVHASGHQAPSCANIRPAFACDVKAGSCLAALKLPRDAGFPYAEAQSHAHDAWYPPGHA